MADTTREIVNLEEGTPCRVLGKVKIVFEMSSGQSKHGTWHRQDFILQDEEGETKVGWFGPGPTEKMTILQGAEVEVRGEVNHYTNKSKERVTSIKASGPNAVKALDGADLSQPPGATNSPAPAQGTHQGQRTAQNAQGAVQRQDASVPTDRDFVRWLKEAGEAVAGVVSGWGDPTTPHGEAAVITTVGSILTGMRIGAEHGKLRLTYGEKESPARQDGPDEEELAAYRGGAGAGDEEDDDSIPFALFLAPLLGALLSGVV